MAHANIMTFTDPRESIRVRIGDGEVYIYWQIGTYLALNQAEAVQLRDALSLAIVEQATAAAKAVQAEGEAA